MMNEDEEMTLYPESYDRFNDRHGRDISNTDTFIYNCGGYALETYIWEEPTVYVDAYETAFDTDFCDMDDLSAYERFMDSILEQSVQNMLEEFNGRLERISYQDIFCEATKNLTIVAFRIACNVGNYIDEYDEDDDFEPENELTFDIDFHFAKRKDGRWTEKMGSGSITNSIFTDSTILEPWDHGYYNYNSSVAFFVLPPIEKTAA